MEFHREMTDIFTSVRDLHTNYLLPAPYSQMTAFLPFMVESYFEGGQRIYRIAHRIGLNHPTLLVPGVEVIYWNGVPVDRAVANNAQRFAGSNRDARHARGVQTLTTRALRIAPPPDEEWVVVGYRTLSGKLTELRLDWQVNPPLPSAAETGPRIDPGAATMGLDLEQDIIQRMRLALFAPKVVAAERRASEKTARGDTFADLDSQLPNVLQARKVTSPAGEFGYLRVRTFRLLLRPSFPNSFA